MNGSPSGDLGRVTIEAEERGDLGADLYPGPLRRRARNLGGRWERPWRVDHPTTRATVPLGVLPTAASQLCTGLAAAPLVRREGVGRAITRRV